MRDTCAIRSNIAGYLSGFKEVLDRERSLGHADFLVKLTPVGGVVLALELDVGDSVYMAQVSVAHTRCVKYACGK